MSGKKKIRTDFRKRHQPRRRSGDLTRQFSQADPDEIDDVVQSERVSGKGELTRKRTVIGKVVEGEQTFVVTPEVDDAQCLAGRVFAVHGLSSYVWLDDGREVECATRGLLKTLSTDQRHVVVAGDRVLVRLANDREGFIERIEPRHGVISRQSKGRQHVLVANVDRIVIVVSAAEPSLKPNLIDRFLVTADRVGIQPLICINKIDLVNPADLQPLTGVFAQMGYQVLLLSATTGRGIGRLRSEVAGHESVFVGQSGVGKSSLLNAIDPGLDLKVSSVSRDNQKGRHTTTTARLIQLSLGGYLVDTPGIRQMQLWDVIPEEVAGYYRDIRPYTHLCRFPDCTHTHEDDCAVKDAVADGHLDARRYESYCHLRNDEPM